MGSSDRYADGEWNFFCDLCGRKAKSSQGVKTWDNHYVCRHHKEVRNPQDFVRGVRDSQSVPWTRPEATDTYINSGAQLIRDTNFLPLLDTSGHNIYDKG